MNNARLETRRSAGIARPRPANIFQVWYDHLSIDITNAPTATYLDECGALYLDLIRSLAPYNHEQHKALMASLDNRRTQLAGGA